MITLHTNKGPIVIELDTDNTPLTAKNFIDYAKSGFFDGTIFHRVINKFMIQAGGFTEDMEQKSSNDSIENEADKGEKNVRGSLAMARTSDPHSASSQFFINLVDNSFLDHKDKSPNGWGYCVFGKVTDGMDVVDEISQVQTGNSHGHQDVPSEPIIIEQVIVD